MLHLESGEALQVYCGQVIATISDQGVDSGWYSDVAGN